MPRRINEKRYGISNTRYRMLVNFCYMLPEWQQWLREHEDTVASPTIDGQPHGQGGKSEPTAELVIKREKVRNNVRAIEEAAKEAGGTVAGYILKDVSNPEIFYHQFEHQIHCGRSTYFKMRKDFFRILDKKI